MSKTGSRAAVVAILLAAALAAMGQPAGSTCFLGPNQQVLVVSTNNVVLGLTLNLLMQLGHEPGRIRLSFEGLEGASALQLLRRTAYGLLILDWNLERCPMSGRQLVQEIRKSPGLATLPVLVIVANQEAADAAKAAGATGCLIRPFNAEGLRRKITEAWCPFREANLQGKDFRKANLQGADMIRANLQGADMGGANLQGALLIGANLGGVNLSGADLTGASLRDAGSMETADTRGAVFSNTILPDGKVFLKNQSDADRARAGHKYLTYANLSRADLSRADLTSAYLNHADLGSANLSNANLKGAHLDGARLEGVTFRDTVMPDGSVRAPTSDSQRARLGDKDLRDARLQGADLAGVDLAGANLAAADLTGANLSGANLGNAILQGATLSRTALSNADLRSANLKGARGLDPANVVGALFSNATVMPDGRGWVGPTYRWVRLFPFTLPPGAPLEVVAADGRTPPFPDLGGSAPHPLVRFWGGDHPYHQSDPPVYLGAISLFLGEGTFGGGSCPDGSVPADGRLLAIAQNRLLFAVLGNRFGGDGLSVFALPDLRRAVPQPATQYCVNTRGSFPGRNPPCGPPDRIYGEVFLFPSSEYCPCDSLDADGRLLRIWQDNTLFALLGNRFGGDYRSDFFALPDLRRAVPQPGMKYCISAGGTFPPR